MSVQTEILTEVSDLLADAKSALSKLEEVTAKGVAMEEGRADVYKRQISGKLARIKL